MKIAISFDTVTKDLSVTRDGLAVENLSSIEFYPSYDGEGKFRMMMHQEKMSADESYTLRMTTMAKLLGLHTDEN